MDTALAWKFINRVRDAGFLPQEHTPKYGEAISKHIVSGPDHVVSPDTGTEWLHAEILRVYDAARELLGVPIHVDAGSRTPEHEALMQSQGYKTAKIVSIHNLSALDLAATGVTNSALQNALKEAAKSLNLPTPRLGHIAYGERFTHFDMGFLFFEPYTTLAHPGSWSDLLDDATRKQIDHAWRPGVEW
jgi:hypothetical protein